MEKNHLFSSISNQIMSDVEHFFLKRLYHMCDVVGGVDAQNMC